jgi:hypothetical protein
MHCCSAAANGSRKGAEQQKDTLLNQSMLQGKVKSVMQPC